jgi:hypothetical protein
MHFLLFSRSKNFSFKPLGQVTSRHQVVQEEMKKNLFFLLFPRSKSISFKAFGQVRSRHQLVQEEMKKNAF